MALAVAAVIWLGAGVVALRAEGYVAKVWHTDDGLPHSAVTSIAQTPDGYLWLATLHGGLARFDGVSFVNFGPSSQPALAAIEIHKLLVDAEGTLWIGSVAGAVYSYRDGRFTTEYSGEGLRTEILNQVLAISSNEVLLATDKGRWLRGVGAPDKPKRWEVIQPREGDASPVVCRDREGTVWYRTRNGGLGRWRGGQFELVPPELLPKGTRVNVLTTDGQGNLWVGTDRELASWAGDHFQSRSPASSEPTLEVAAITCTGDQRFWVTANGRLREWAAGEWVKECREWDKVTAPAYRDSKGGLWFVHRGKGVFHLEADGRGRRLTPADGLPGNLVLSWFEDRESNIWLGVNGTGLVRLDPQVFEIVTLDSSEPDQAFTSVCEAAPGDVWLGTAQGSVFRWHGNELTRHSRLSSQPFSQDATVYPDTNGTLWVGTVGNGLFTLTGGVFSRPFPQEQLGRVVRVLFQDHEQRLWIGNEYGLHCWQEGKLRNFGPADGFGRPFVVAMAEDSPGSLWIGTTESELWHYAKGKFTRFAFGGGTERLRFWSLLPDADGSIWIGTLGGGLLRFRDGQFTRYQVKDGLPSQHVSQVLDDAEGNLWLGTRNGICRVAKAALHAFAAGKLPRLPCVTYGRSDGLLTAECSGGYQPSGWRGADGRLWFATARGAVSVQPRDVPRNPLPPPVVVEELRVDGQPVAGLAPRAGRAALRIGPGQHYFEFRFTGLSYTAPEKVRFRWRLDGLETDWVEGGSARAASYSFLPPGSYRFRVTACNNDGVWNEGGQSVAFTVLPFFWQTWWFKGGSGGAAMVAILGVALSAQRRRHRARMGILERQAALERERTRIARDIHDQVGANLTKIGKLTELLDRQLAVSEPHKPVLHTVANTTREIVQAMDEIVWAVNPRNDTLENAANYLVHYTEDFLSLTGIACDLDVPFNLPPTPVSAELRHNLFMATKEALNNAVKHGRPARVRLTLEASEKRLTVGVTDDGCGFAPAARLARRNGLENMQKRVESIGGKFHLDSAPGRGTTIRLEVPLGKSAGGATHVYGY